EQKTLPGRPIGPTRVQLPDGDQWQFKFVKVACNVAAPVGQEGNRLGELLQKWFGKDAGLPGTHFTVRFESKDGRWKVTPLIGVSEVSREIDQLSPDADAESIRDGS
ncbi:MAG TPA: hypothetical protein DDZ51_05595, partial [Planctomycetaceae bacterium]|nr:hypothetical protein [Planctomycetaceae bacterium]